MTEQLGFEIETPAPERRFECCGALCGPLGADRVDFPHSEDCPNPNLGKLFDRWGRQIFWLCCTREKPCPPGGCQRHRDRFLPVLRSAA
jgi:hypothetical protein